jgi:hypothetical protein
VSSNLTPAACNHAESRSPSGIRARPRPETPPPHVPPETAGIRLSQGATGAQLARRTLRIRGDARATGARADTIPGPRRTAGPCPATPRARRLTLPGGRKANPTCGFSVAGSTERECCPRSARQSDRRRAPPAGGRLVDRPEASRRSSYAFASRERRRFASSRRRCRGARCARARSLTGQSSRRRRRRSFRFVRAPRRESC